MGNRPLTDRVAELKDRRDKTKKKLEQYDAQVKRLEKLAAEEERKNRTHKLIVCGAELASLFGKVLELDEVLTIVNFLREQQQMGNFTALKIKAEGTEVEQAETKEMENEEDDIFKGMFGF